MNILVLGRGKTGSLIVEVARERGHEVSVLTGKENPRASALTPECLSKINVVLDFTTPEAVLDNISACIRSRTNIVVGTTGWYNDLGRVRQEVESNGTGLLYSPNFFIGVNIFFEAARTAAAALHQGYFGQIFERH
ncbi:MAG TPA: 4-hydroxy-tetrahydrodipicolinate reductase, partial [Terriglobales bacterium]|nr:4-hydroxy-tetrahydrodipicolinate reductase [Terriglobales bacterium]